MTARSLAKFVCAAIVGLGVQLVLPTQPASAAPCPDIEVVFARGTAEPPGLGITGTSFAESVRLRSGGKSVGTYGVNYAASADFNHPLNVVNTAMDGIRDAQGHVQFMAANCPGTRIVLGGYSQGAVVAALATMATTPAGVRPEYAANVPPPMPPQIAGHVAAVVLFGSPSDRFMLDIGAPVVTVGPAYLAKTRQYCIPFDNICDGQPARQPNGLHVLYGFNGMTFDGAGFAVGHA
ncbi:cutinase family protein [Aldersonia sp. NBC_00410]|uniref:cutinase family protein n=1 Tax=Aldersonia sp. NBC_00410 TaxID=2975954 RepID=UPI0022529BEC|nr:cutinase family protein [Aldersonia sp. NBC_00410]MCX5045493.1 cutinase family protein [Aldersonia sp. NBC_00410]